MSSYPASWYHYYTTTATRTISVAGEGYITTTFTLPPQTTTFAPPARYQCSTDLWCPQGMKTPGGRCTAWDRVDETHFTTLRPECYPPGYDALYEIGDPCE
jgi:hypothetical protein